MTQTDEAPAKQRFLKKLEAQRDEAMRKIVAAHTVEAWGQNQQTNAFLGVLKERLEGMERDMHTALDMAEKPISSADQCKYQGRRAELQSVIAMIEHSHGAVQRELSAALAQEREVADENGMFYQPPAWGEDWLAEARKRMNDGWPAEKEDKKGRRRALEPATA